jgi:hypothetical protein
MTRFIPFLLVLLAVGCGPSDTLTRGGEVPGTTAQMVTADEFQSLRWIEGRWRGSGSEVSPFYESYEFISDTVIRIRSYADAAFQRPNDSSLVVLSAGLIQLGGPVRWQASTMDSQSVRFIPLGDAPNTVTWRQATDTSWTVLLDGVGEGEDSEVTYHMTRVASRQ